MERDWLRWSETRMGCLSCFAASCCCANETLAHDMISESCRCDKMDPSMASA